MKLVLDWDEDTIDLVKGAITDAIDIIGELRIFTDSEKKETASMLREALKDLGGGTDDDEDDGIFPVKELLGAHEVRLLKEDGL